MNDLFAGPDRGSERAAAMYSLIGSAKLNVLDPEAYLSKVLIRITDHPIKTAPGNCCPETSTPKRRKSLLNRFVDT